MQNVDMRKIYNFYPVQPKPDPSALPTGGDIYYECTECNGIVSSVSFIKAACTCGNLTGGGGKTTIQDPTKVNVVRGKLK